MSVSDEIIRQIQLAAEKGDQDRLVSLKQLLREVLPVEMSGEAREAVQRVIPCDNTPRTQHLPKRELRRTAEMFGHKTNGRMNRDELQQLIEMGPIQ